MWVRTGEGIRPTPSACRIRHQPKNAEAVGDGEAVAHRRLPGNVFSPGGWPLSAVEVDAECNAIRRRTLGDSSERNPHRRIPALRGMGAGRGNLKSRVPLPTFLVMWGRQVDVKIDPFALRRDFELFIAPDIVEIRADENLRDVP